VTRTLPRAVLLAVLLLAGGCAPRGGSTGAGNGAVQATDAWSRTSAAGAQVGVLYLTLTSDHADRLIGVTVPDTVAASAEMHGIYHDAAGQLAMRALDHVDLPARAPVAFYPGSMHIMLMGLARPLVAGESFDATLRFRDAGQQVVRVVVRDE